MYYSNKLKEKKIMKPYYNTMKIKFLSKWNRLKIVLWLKFKGVKNYVINENLTVDVNGDVDLRGIGCKKLPIQFGKINGSFYCIGLGLITLKGCPEKVTGNFECHANNLKSLKYSPIEVGNSYSCENNQLISLEYCPVIIHGDFDCSNNRLENLTVTPNLIKGNFDCSNNTLLKDLKMINHNLNIEGYFHHCIENEENKIIFFNRYYEDAYYNKFAQTGLFYKLILKGIDFTEMKSKMNLKIKLETILENKNKSKNKVLKI